MVEELQKRKTLNNDTEYLIVSAVNHEGQYQLMIVNMKNGVAKFSNPLEIEEKLPIIINS